MSSTTVTLSPLNEVRTAIYEILAAADLGVDVEMAAEASEASMPYVAVGPAYKGAGGTDIIIGTAAVVVQIDCFASSVQGGAHKVGEMAYAVADALSVEITTTVRGVETRPFIVEIDDDVLTPAIQDEAGGPVYARRRLGLKCTVAE